MRKVIIAIGLVLLCVGILWPWVTKLGLGRLPGDIVVKKSQYTLYFPITTMIILSVIISLIIRLWRR